MLSPWFVFLFGVVVGAALGPFLGVKLLVRAFKLHGPAVSAEKACDVCGNRVVIEVPEPGA